VPDGVRTTRRVGRLSPDDRAASLWRYVDVEVGPGCPGLEVRLSYERIAGTLDLGCQGPAGWRGWSGGARDRFVITPTAATPGYLPGELEPGTWQVVLGLHQVPAQGLGYELVISTGRSEPAAEAAPLPPPDRPPRRQLPAARGLSWLAGDFHSHTTHSDGAHTLDNLAVLAAGRGLDFVAVTDHNTVSHHPHLAAAGARAGILLLPGQEVTTDSGHANALGDIGWIDFRRPADRWYEDVADRGGVLSVNHPVSGDCAWRHRTARRPAAAEIWHGSWADRRDGGALAWWTAHGAEPVPLGGSDWHGLTHEAPPGAPTTWVACDAQDVLGGVLAGRTAISAGRDGPLLLRVDDELIALDADGTVLRCPDGARRVVRGDRARFPGAPGPHLLETGARAVLALAN
jgi:hypothetical protein